MKVAGNALALCLLGLEYLLQVEMETGLQFTLWGNTAGYVLKSHRPAPRVIRRVVSSTIASLPSLR